jgi:ABC-type branched-subunit amino acid transport system ATPase component/ABC-type branched-subunit amino acid transport system permease subunit
VLLTAAALIPLDGNVVLTQVGVLVLLYVGAAVAWNIFSGFTGYISLGAAVFFGTGVYTVAVITKHLNLVGGVVFWLYPLGGLVAAVVAVPFGLIALRVRRHTFVVVTIAVFFIFQLMAYNFSWTGGASGLIPQFLNWNEATVYNPFYYTALLIAIVAAVLAWAIWGSRFGLQLRAIRDDEDRARGLGVKTMRVKLTAFVISAFIIGTLGGLYFYFQSDALPQYAFNPFFDLTIALMAFLGGFGTLAGPIFGALLLEPYLGWAQQQVTNTYAAEIVLGVLFLVVIIFLPRGILPTVSEKLTAIRASRRRRATERRDRGREPRRADQQEGVMTALLRTEGVSKAFGGVQALNDCSIDVERGSIAGLIGPNGSGKTTLFNMITGYGRVDSGDVYLNDAKITSLAPDKVFARGIGRTFQLTRVFSRLTVMENMIVAAHYKERAGQTGRLHNPFARAGGPATRKRAMELLEFTGIAKLAGDRAETLSYGQRKLLELSYVLMAEPAIILLDEPAGGVNPTLIGTISERIRELNRQGTTFLIVEHNMEFVMGLCDQVTVLDYGNAVVSGPPDVIRNDDRVLDAYLGTAEEDDDSSAA